MIIAPESLESAVSISIGMATLRARLFPASFNFAVSFSLQMELGTMVS